jgi:endonuclease YncB( thermonuclease family)
MREQGPRKSLPLRRLLPFRRVVVALLFASAVVPFIFFTSSDARVVQLVVDGDTFVSASGERVRLIGVDTPETKHPKKPVERFGKEASAFSGNKGSACTPTRSPLLNTLRIQQPASAKTQMEEFRRLEW